MNTTPNMLLITSSWGNPAIPTFRMIPVALESPFQECIYDPEAGVLAVISKTPKQSYIMVHKVDENGDPVPTKNNAPRAGGARYKEERRLVDTYQEYYIEDEKEIIDFVNMFSMVPARGKLDFTQFLKKTLPPGEVSLGEGTAAKMKVLDPVQGEEAADKHSMKSGL